MGQNKEWLEPLGFILDSFWFDWWMKKKRDGVIRRKKEREGKKTSVVSRQFKFEGEIESLHKQLLQK